MPSHPHAKTVRFTRSLEHLTPQLIQLLVNAPASVIDIGEVARQLGVVKRRVYDMTTVLDAIGLIIKVGKNKFRKNPLVDLMEKKGEVELQKESREEENEKGSRIVDMFDQKVLETIKVESCDAFHEKLDAHLKTVNMQVAEKQNQFFKSLENNPVVPRKRSGVKRGYSPDLNWKVEAPEGDETDVEDWDLLEPQAKKAMHFPLRCVGNLLSVNSSKRYSFVNFSSHDELMLELRNNLRDDSAGQDKKVFSKAVYSNYKFDTLNISHKESEEFRIDLKSQNDIEITTFDSGILKHCESEMPVFKIPDEIVKSVAAVNVQCANLFNGAFLKV